MKKPRFRASESLLTHIRAAHASGRRTYGSPRVHAYLRGIGVNVSRRRVASLMRLHNLVGRQKKQFIKTTIRGKGGIAKENLLDRQFAATHSDQKWVTDISYVRTADGWLYLAVVIDLFSRRVVGYAMANNMRVELPLKALRNAVAERRPKPGLLHHSDQGCQYTSYAYQDALTSAGMVSSMSRTGECWDNSVAESFFGRLKEELIHHRNWESHAQAERAIADYIDSFYNKKRIQKSLGYLCPNQYEHECAGSPHAA